MNKIQVMRMTPVCFTYITDLEVSLICIPACMIVRVTKSAHNEHNINQQHNTILVYAAILSRKAVSCNTQRRVKLRIMLLHNNRLHRKLLSHCMTCVGRTCTFVVSGWVGVVIGLKYNLPEWQWTQWLLKRVCVYFQVF